jgi:hypothetical protein
VGRRTGRRLGSIPFENHRLCWRPARCWGRDLEASTREYCRCNISKRRGASNAVLACADYVSSCKLSIQKITYFFALFTLLTPTLLLNWNLRTFLRSKVVQQLTEGFCVCLSTWQAMWPGSFLASWSQYSSGSESFS